MNNYQHATLQFIGEEFKQYSQHDLSEELAEFFKADNGKPLGYFIEERHAYLSLTFGDFETMPHIVLGFGDVAPRDFDGLLQWGVYSPDGNDLGVWGETQLTTPERIVEDIFKQIDGQLTKQN